MYEYVDLHNLTGKKKKKKWHSNPTHHPAGWLAAHAKE